MRAEEVVALVDRELSGFVYSPPEGTIGSPFSPERVAREIDLLRESLVPPRLVAAANGQAESVATQELWQVTCPVDRGCVVVFDAGALSFGLAFLAGDSLPQTIGVWGDLVGTFMAR